MTTFVLVILCLITVTLAYHDGIMNLYRNKFTGDGTYYGAGEHGTCSYAPPGLPPAAWHIRRVALNAPQFFGSLACGMCFKVHGTGQGLGNSPIRGDFFVFVKDLCPECQAGSIDLAENGDGRWKVQIQAVQCPVGNSKLEYKFQGSNPWYLKIQIRNSRIPVTSLSLWQPNSRQWSAMKPSSDGFWLMGDGYFEKPVNPYPIKMKLTAANGAVVYDQINSIRNDVIIWGTGQQFPHDPNLLQA